MTRGGNEEVVRLDVSVDEHKTMGFFNSQYHFGDIKASNCLMQHVLANEQAQKVATGHVLHDKIQVGCILKATDECHNPFVSLERSEWSDLAEKLTTLRLQRRLESPSRREDVLLGCYEACLICV